MDTPPTANWRRTPLPEFSGQAKGRYYEIFGLSSPCSLWNRYPLSVEEKHPSPSLCYGTPGEISGNFAS